jgi:lipid A oxidase
MISALDFTWRKHSSSAERPPRGAQLLDVLGSLAAIAALSTTLVGALIEQAPGDSSPATAASSAPAAPRATPSADLGPEFMIAGYGGAPYTYPSDVSVQKPGVHDFTAKDVPWKGEPFKNPIYYGVRIARWFGNGVMGSMLDFTHSKVLAQRAEEVLFEGTFNGEKMPERAKIQEYFKRLEASHGHNMLTLNGLLRLPGFGWRLHPYVGLGGGINLPHSEVWLDKDNSRTYEYQYAGPVGQALIGLEFRTSRASYFFEYKFSLAKYDMPLSQDDGSILFFDLWRQFSRWWKSEAPDGGRLQTDFISHQAIAGIGLRIAARPAVAP